MLKIYRFRSVVLDFIGSGVQDGVVDDFARIADGSVAGADSAASGERVRRRTGHDRSEQVWL